MDVAINHGNDTISELRDMHCLTALDVGKTALSSWGVSRLAKSLIRKPAEDIVRRISGPWTLRILCLRDCMNIDDDVYHGLVLFPLLSVVGEYR